MKKLIVLLAMVLPLTISAEVKLQHQGNFRPYRGQWQADAHPWRRTEQLCRHEHCRHRRGDAAHGTDGTQHGAGAGTMGFN